MVNFQHCFPENMPSVQYDFEAFIERIKPFDRFSMITEAIRACDTADTALNGRRSGAAARKTGAGGFTARLKAFIFYMQNNAIPLGSGLADWIVYKEITELLVQRGEIPEDLLRSLKYTLTRCRRYWSVRKGRSP